MFTILFLGTTIAAFIFLLENLLGFQIKPAISDRGIIELHELKVELKSEVSKELFLYYQATPVITHYLKPTNKVSFTITIFVF